MPTKRPTFTARSLQLESLEDRRVMATFGTPWPEPRSLNVSFPSDSAGIGHYENSLRTVLDQVADRQEWQEATLRAFQTWAVHANINIGLSADRGDDFGTLGLGSNDPRFGEFRIGAFPQPGVLANASPYQQRAGTWAGDVLLNSQINYFLGDWLSTSPIDVPDANEKGPAVELYSVLLHEAGNALGLADNTQPGAVMNGTYSGPNGTLKASDITAIRDLYGRRQDIYESTNNNARSRATRIFNPPGYTGTEPLAVSGSLNSHSDVDFYRITPLPGQEKLNVRLWAAGISLLKAKLEVQDRFGNKIGDVKADSIFQNNLELEIGSLSDSKHQTLFIKVERNTDDVFAIGDYRLEIDYRPYAQQPSLLPPQHDADADDDDQSQVDFVSVDGLFAQAGLLDSELGTNDTLTSATVLQTTTGFLANTRYETTSSISSSTDRDLWRFSAPAFPSPTLHLTIDPVGLVNPHLEAIVLSAGGDRLETQATRKADGGLSITVVNPIPAADYIVLVRTLAGSPIASGNYFLTADFATAAADNTATVYSAVVSSGSEHISRLNIGKTQLFRFDLLSASANAHSGVQLTLYNSMTGDVVGSFAAAAGIVRTEYVWLSAGSYYLRASSRAQSGFMAAPVTFTLLADAISDDQGPNPIDPDFVDLPEFYLDYDWEQLYNPPPIIEYIEPPFEDPWNSDYFDDYYAGYYEEYLA